MVSLTWTYTTRSGLSDSTRFFFVVVVVTGAALGGAVVEGAALVVVAPALGEAAVVGAALGAAVVVAVPVAAVLPAVVVAVHLEHPAEDMAAASGVVMELIFEEFTPIIAMLAGGL